MKTHKSAVNFAIVFGAFSMPLYFICGFNINLFHANPENNKFA